MLKRCGCYVDMTMPSAPSPTQARTINRVYYAGDRPGRPRGHDYGRPIRHTGRDDVVASDGYPSCNARGRASLENPVQARKSVETEAGLATASPPRRSQARDAGARYDELMIIPGPLALDWTRRKWGVMPRIENADLTAKNPPTRHRVEIWLRQNVGIRGLPTWTFAKVHTHGCLPANRDMLLSPTMVEFHNDLQTLCDDRDVRLHYLTAREMYNVARAAEDGIAEWSRELRDYEISPPPWNT